MSNKKKMAEVQSAGKSKSQINYWLIAIVILIIIIIVLIVSTNSSQRMIVIFGILLVGILIYTLNSRRAKVDAFEVIEKVKTKVFRDWGAILDSSPESLKVERRGAYYIVTGTIMMEHAGVDPVRHRRSFHYNINTGLIEGISTETPFEFQERLRNDAITSSQIEKGNFPDEDRFQ